MTTTHFMLDIETAGTRPGSVILSIGATVFQPELDGVFPLYSSGDGASGPAQFHQYIDVDSCLNAGLLIDGHTFKWWMQQSDDARAQFSTSGDGEPLTDVMANFCAWIEALQPLKADRRVWAKGPDFDCVLVEQALLRCGLKAPWNHNAKRDVRTYCEAGGIDPNAEQFLKGTKHNALDDAISQATAVQAACRALNPSA